MPGRLLIGRMTVLALAVLAFAMPATAGGKSKEYAGADAGYLVHSAGTVSIGMHFDFSYRRVATVDGAAVADWKGKIQPRLGGAIYLKVKNPDFTGKETGHVVVTRLPPGNYEVHSFGFAGSTALGSVHWSPSKPFSLPFTIRPGEATYIGSFMRSPSLGTSLQPKLGAAGFFVVADRSDRDLPIARTRLPAEAALTQQVTDVSQFGSLALRTAQP